MVVPVSEQDLLPQSALLPSQGYLPDTFQRSRKLSSAFHANMSVRTSNRCSSPHTCAFVISCVTWRMNFFIRQEWQQRVTSHFLHSIPVPHHSIRTFQLFIRQYPEYDPIKHDAIKIPYNIYVLFTADLLWYFPAKDITLLLLIKILLYTAQNGK